MLGDQHGGDQNRSAWPSGIGAGPVPQPWQPVPQPSTQPSPARPPVLLDLKFERRLTPVLVRWIYLGSILIATVAVVFGLLWIWSFSTWLGAAMWLAAPILIGSALLSVIVVRIFCEW